MENEKNISLVIKQPEEEHEGVVISFSTIFSYLRRFFLIWIIVAAIVLMFVMGGVMLIKTTVADTKVTALVNFDYEGIEEGLDPYGKPFDVNKIKSPSIIEAALSDLNESLSYVEIIRKSITIEGVAPDEAMDKLSLYQEVYSGGGNAGLVAADRLIVTECNPVSYIITLDYGSAGLTLNQSKQVLDGMLRNYQDYFFTTYGYNQSLGTSVVAIDYTDYDYSAALDVFSSTLVTLDEYVSTLALSNPTFRSGRTGYSFEDLSTTINTLKTAEVDSLSSYVIINNVSNDKEVLLTYYEYKIEELKRKQKVYQAELESISKSIENYEKDTMLIYGEGVDPENNTFTRASEKYDELIEQKVAKQNELSRCKQDITYFETRFTALKKSSGTSSDEMKAEVEERLAALHGRINNIIDTVNKTSDEYYENVTFAHAYNILVPASGTEPTVATSDLILPVIIGEIAAFAGYFVVSVIKAISADYSRQKAKKEAREAREAAKAAKEAMAE